MLGGGGGDPTGGFMSGLSPLGLMAAGGLLSAPQQYMQQRMGWLKTNMTGGTMSALFDITPAYGELGGGGGHAARAAAGSTGSIGGGS